MPDQPKSEGVRTPAGAVAEEPAGGQEHRRRARVVVGVDGSEAAQAALERALEEARRRNAVLQVVHAWQYPFELTATSGAVPLPAADMEQWANQVVDDALQAAGVGDVVEIVRQVVNGSAVAVLSDAADGADMLVVGTRGHSRLTGLFLGSVSQYLAVRAPCPVLIVHAPRPAPPAPTAERATAPVTPEAPTAAPGAPGSPELSEIPEDECLALLAGQRVGRLIVVHDGVPQAYPVNYVLDGRTVAVRTDPGVLLDWATLGQVAFEVDQVDEEAHQGWSVVVHGVGRDVTDGVDAWSERVRARTLEPWAGGERHHWVALATPRVTGRRIVRHDPEPVRPLSRT